MCVKLNSDDLVQITFIIAVAVVMTTFIWKVF